MIRVGSRRRAVATAALLILGTWLAAGAGAAAQSSAPNAVTLQADPTGAPPRADKRAIYTLGADDQIMIHAIDVPDISDKAQRIDPNGDLRLPIVGRIHAAGLTIEQLEAEIAIH